MEKEKKYQELEPQIQALMQVDVNLVAKMANFTALLYEKFNWLWVGFYIVDKDRNELILAPFQGSSACYKIAYNKGVCGTAWAKKETIIVENVHQFEGHIACSSLSNSEIVVPIFDDKKDVLAVLDIDSTKFDDFDEVDKKYLEAFCKYL